MDLIESIPVVVMGKFPRVTIRKEKENPTIQKIQNLKPWEGDTVPEQSHTV